MLCWLPDGIKKIECFESIVGEVWTGGFENNVLFLNIFLCIAIMMAFTKTDIKLSSMLLLCIFCTTSLAKNLLAVVVFNGEKFTGHFNVTLLKSSFEKISSISKTNNSLKFVFFDLNSTVCGYRKFLSFFAHEQDIRQFALVVVIESCSCERQLSRFFHLIVGVKIISSCEKPVILTVSILLRKHFKHQYKAT